MCWSIKQRTAHIGPVSCSVLEEKKKNPPLHCSVNAHSASDCAFAIFTSAFPLEIGTNWGNEDFSHVKSFFFSIFPAEIVKQSALFMEWHQSYDRHLHMWQWSTICRSDRREIKSCSCSSVMWPPPGYYCYWGASVSSKLRPARLFTSTHSTRLFY